MNAYPKLLSQCTLKPGETLEVGPEYTGDAVKVGSKHVIKNLVVTTFEHPLYNYEVNGMIYKEGDNVAQVIYETENGHIIWPHETVNGYKEVKAIKVKK